VAIQPRRGNSAQATAAPSDAPATENGGSGPSWV